MEFRTSIESLAIGRRMTLMIAIRLTRYNLNPVSGSHLECDLVIAKVILNIEPFIVVIIKMSHLLDSSKIQIRIDLNFLAKY